MLAKLRLTREAPAGTRPRKPLYLATRSRIRVNADGNHLILHRAGGERQRYPLARISRIICNRQADWSGDALALCLAEGIPLIWLDGRGATLGSALSRIAPAVPLGVRLESYVEGPDWTERFDNWIRRRRLETITSWALRCAREGRAPDASEFHALKRDYVYKGEVPQVFAPEGHAWCYALVVRHLQEQGLEARYWGHGGKALELADELTALLWAELNLDCGTLAADAPPDRTLMLLFETWAQHGNSRFALHLGDLKRYLARENETWR